MGDHITGYAKAFFELARAEGDLERVEEEVAVVGRAIDGSTELRSTLTDPQLSLERKQAIIDDLVGARASSLTTGLVQLVLGQGHIGQLSAIATSFIETAAESRDKAVAEVRTAVPIDDATVERLTAALGRATGKNVEVKVIIDESVIGGVVARVGDTVIDGSVARRVDSLRQVVRAR